MPSLRPDRRPIHTAVCIRELPALPEVTALVGALREEPYPWLLESALVTPRLGRYSFAGASPYAVLRSFGNENTLECTRSARSDVPLGETKSVGDSLAFVRSLLPPRPTRFLGAEASHLPFIGGAVGYLGYELACQLTDSLGEITLTGRDDLALPDQVQLFVDRLVAIDHAEERAFAVALGFGEQEAKAASRSEAVCAALEERVADVPRARPSTAVMTRRLLGEPLEAVPVGVETFFDESAYGAAVAQVAERIAAGDLYQANLTHRMEQPLVDRAPWLLYQDLRETNPAPFGAYLELPEVALLSSSPERFLSLDAARAVESRPIKGTRPRGATPEEDVLLAKELEASEKDRAENLMIVDLVRNDLGRVCETGSVAVPELRTIECYATVFQMVSSVTGQLREGQQALDLVRACFPPGSMTGAPKIAAMKLIDSIEPVRRGAYAGALGYLDVRGGLDLSVVIRALFVQDGRAYLHVGGGIVADSDPIAEYRETLDKARALLEVLASAERRARVG